jgi:hypothetical protein
MTSCSGYYVALSARRVLRGGCQAPPLRNVSHFLPHFSCHLDFHVHFWEFFRHMVFSDGFLFPVKELGLLTNPGHWVRVLDVVGSYMYIVL